MVKLIQFKGLDRKGSQITLTTTCDKKHIARVYKRFKSKPTYKTFYHKSLLDYAHEL